MFVVVVSCDLDRDIDPLFSVSITHCMLTYIRLSWCFRRFFGELCRLQLSKYSFHYKSSSCRSSSKVAVVVAAVVVVTVVVVAVVLRVVAVVVTVVAVATVVVAKVLVTVVVLE